MRGTDRGKKQELGQIFIFHLVVYNIPKCMFISGEHRMRKTETNIRKMKYSTSHQRVSTRRTKTRILRPSSSLL